MNDEKKLRSNMGKLYRNWYDRTGGTVKDFAQVVKENPKFFADAIGWEPEGAARSRSPRRKVARALNHRLQRFTAPATNNESFELWSKRTAPAALAPTCCAPAPESATKAGQRMRAV